MVRYLFNRLLQTIPVIFIMSVIIFSLVLIIPGDPLRALMGPGATLTPEAEALARAELGLDDPLPVRYVNWLTDTLQGDLGRSTATRQPVSDALVRRFPVTLQLAVFGMAFAVVFALPLGMIAALRPNSTWDVVASFIAVLGLAVPNFWLAVLMIIAFSVNTNWLPASGYVSVFEDPIGAMRYMVMPAIALGAPTAAGLMRYIRSGLLEVLNEDYIRTAHAKGLHERMVLIRHALKPSLIPAVTVLGVSFGRMIGGSLIIESIFLIPGIGSLMVNGIFQRDFPVIQSGALVLAVVVILLNLFVDVIYGYIDPRISYQ